MQPPNNSNQRRIKLEYKPDLNATYSNMVLISHTPNEFIFDFIQRMPPDGRMRVQERVVMSPTHAKLLLRAIAENVQKYETRYGEIDLPQSPGTLADQLFSSVAGTSGDGGDTDDGGNNDEN